MQRETLRRVLATWQRVLTDQWHVLVLMLLAFVIGQVLSLLLVDSPLWRLFFDLTGWVALTALAVWLSLAWSARREQQHQADLTGNLQRQQELNAQLQRANRHLALLSETNQHIALSATLDDILDAALLFPQRLVPAQAAALVLCKADGLVEARTQGSVRPAAAMLREACDLPHRVASSREPQLVPLAGATHGAPAQCVLLPLHDGLQTIGWIELYLTRPLELADDEAQLLATIASEIAEAIASLRQRAAEVRAMYELERAIEEERARIARDIHDGLAQSIAFLRLRVDLWLDWLDDDPQRLGRELQDLKGTLRMQIAELRRAIFALRPVQFDELGFVAGLRRYVEEFANQQDWELAIDLERAPATLPPELEAVAFRVVQEGLTNAAKHAQASRVEVCIEQVQHGLQVVVRDDGQGFDPATPGDYEGYQPIGLRQMEERLAVVRGQLTVLAHPGTGTELRAWIPLAAPTVADAPPSAAPVSGAAHLP